MAALPGAQRVVWLSLVLLVPLWVNLWGQQPFELPKAALMRTLVWLMAVLALAEQLLWRHSQRWEWRRNQLLAPLLLLALVLVVSTATAADWRLSMWGSYERAQGALTQLSYLLLCLLAAGQLRRLSRARQLAAAMAATSAPLLVIGLLQLIGWDPFGMSSDARSPVYATLGRANFLGAYLAMLLPLTLSLLLTATRPRLRLMWSLLCAGQMVGLVLTLARGAWLAGIVSLSVFALLWWGRRLARRWRWIGWSGVGLLFASGPLLVLWLGRNGAGSAAGRLTIWQGVWELVRQRPLLGYGPDGLGLVFPAVYAPQLVYYQGRDYFVDRAHNLLLDWGVTAGLPGVLAFLLLLVTFVLLVRRGLDRWLPRRKRALLAALVAAVLGNVANNLVSFDVTATATASWLLVGIGAALADPVRRQTANLVTSVKPDRRRWAVIALLALALSGAMWRLNARPLLADVAAWRGQLHSLHGEPVAARAAAERSVRLWPVEPAHYLQLSAAYWEEALASTKPLDQLAAAENALLEAQRLRPGETLVWLRAAAFYNAAARHFGSDTSALANEAYVTALALAPNQAAIYTAWGRDYLERGDAQAAAPLLRRSVRLDTSDGQAYLYLGAAELALRRAEAAVGAYEEAVRLLPDSAVAYAALADGYYVAGRPDEALRAVEMALQLDPRNVQAVAIQRALAAGQ